MGEDHLQLSRRREAPVALRREAALRLDLVAVDTGGEGVILPFLLHRFELDVGDVLAAELDRERFGPKPPTAAYVAHARHDESPELVGGSRTVLVQIGLVVLGLDRLARGQEPFEPRDDMKEWR